MTYMEMMEKAIKGRSIHATAVALGIPSSTFQRYAKGTRFPTHQATVKIAAEAGISIEEAVRAIANAQQDASKNL